LKIAARSLPILSPFDAKPILPGFDGAALSSDAGPILLRAIERKAGPAGRLAACMADPRDPAKVQHGPDDIIRLPILRIAAGHEDGLDADSLRHDPGFKIALEHAPETRRGPVFAAHDLAQGKSARSDLRRPRRAGRWSGSAATHVRAHRARSCSISTTHSTRCLAPSNCVCSMRFTMSMAPAQCRVLQGGSCSTGTVVLGGEGRLRRGGGALDPPPQGGREFGTYSPLDPADPQTSAQDRNPAARRQPLLHATGSGSVRQARAAPCLRSGREKPSVPEQPSSREQLSGPEQPSGREQTASGGVVCSAVRAVPGKNCAASRPCPPQPGPGQSPAVSQHPVRHARSDRLCLPLVKSAATIVEKKTRILVTLPASCPRQGLQHMLFDAPAPP